MVSPKKGLVLLLLIPVLTACPSTSSADTVKPTVSLSTSSSSVTAPGNLELSAQASDNVGVAKVEFFEGATKLGEDATTPYTLQLPLTSANNGVKNYTAKAFDAAGNTQDSAPVQVTVNISVPPTRGDVNAAFGGIPDWPSFSPRLSDRNESVGSPTTVTETVDDLSYSCGVTPHSITRTPEQIVTLSPNSNVLWPGALIQGRSYLEGIGGLRELTIRERAPLVLTFKDLNFPGNTVLVERPTNASVNLAMGRVLEAAEKDRIPPASRVSFTRSDAHSVQQMMLQMGASASFLFGSASSSLNFSTAANRRTIAAFFVQRAYTVEMNNPGSPADVFSEEFTQAKLDARVSSGEIGSNNPPAYVASVSYGRILVFTLTAEATAQELDGTIVAMGGFAGASGSVNLSTRQRQILANSSIRFVALGGSSDRAEAIIRTGDLRAYFSASPSIRTFVPISYQVNGLKERSIALVSETTNYNLRNCALVRASIPVTSLTVSITAGADALDCNDDGTRSFGSFTTVRGRTQEQLIARCIPSGQTATAEITLPPGIKLGDLSEFNLRVLSRNCTLCQGDTPDIARILVQIQNQFTGGPLTLLNMDTPFRIPGDAIFTRSFPLSNTR